MASVAKERRFSTEFATATTVDNPLLKGLKAGHTSALVSFFPIVEHAFGEDAKKGVFHFQMMTDFETVVEIAQRLLLELD